MYKKIAISCLLASMVMAIPAVSSAYFTEADIIEELKAQIASLLKQVQELQLQLAKQGGSSAVSCHTFNNDLKIGSQGEEVSLLLNALVRNGVAAERSSNFSWNYDEQMASYVTAFQDKYAGEILNPIALNHGTGYFGALTRAKLNQLYGCGEGGGVVPPQPEYQVVTVQNLVANPAGYLSKKVQVTGVLVQTSKTYWPSPEFGIAEGTNVFRVTPWLPFELVVSPAGTYIQSKAAGSMQEVLNKNVTLKGTVVLSGSVYQLQVSSASINSGTACPVAPYPTDWCSGGTIISQGLGKDGCPLPPKCVLPTQTACTMEVKLCPDGKTYVGRSGPNCEFAVCPGQAQ